MECRRGSQTALRQPLEHTFGGYQTSSPAPSPHHFRTLHFMALIAFITLRYEPKDLLESLAVRVVGHVADPLFYQERRFHRRRGGRSRSFLVSIDQNAVREMLGMEVEEILGVRLQPIMQILSPLHMPGLLPLHPTLSDYRHVALLLPPPAARSPNLHPGLLPLPVALLHRPPDHRPAALLPTLHIREIRLGTGLPVVHLPLQVRDDVVAVVVTGEALAPGWSPC